MDEKETMPPISYRTYSDPASELNTAHSAPPARFKPISVVWGVPASYKPETTYGALWKLVVLAKVGAARTEVIVVAASATGTASAKSGRRLRIFGYFIDSLGGCSFRLRSTKSLVVINLRLRPGG